MNERQLRYALAVWRDRSFSKAAHRLNISQPSVSEQVRLLETELGFELFVRTGRGVEVTFKGRTYLHQAEQAVAGLMGLVDTARRLQGGPKGSFAIGFGTAIARELVPWAMQVLGPALPDLQLEVVTAPTRRIQRMVFEERLDVGLAIEADASSLPPHVVRQRLTVVTLALFLAPEHPLAKSGETVTIGQLAKERLIMNEPDVGYGQYVSSLFADLGVRPTVAAVADDVETAKLMVRANVGIAILPENCALNEIASGDLISVPLLPRCTAPVALLRHDTRQVEAPDTPMSLLLGSLGEGRQPLAH